MKSMLGSAAGCCPPAIYREAIRFLSRRSFWPKCLASSGVNTVARTLREVHGPVRAAKLKYATLKVDLREGGCESYETVEEQYNQLLRNLSLRHNTNVCSVRNIPILRCLICHRRPAWHLSATVRRFSAPANLGVQMRFIFTSKTEARS
jgi:hypothetical protein